MRNVAKSRTRKPATADDQDCSVVGGAANVFAALDVPDPDLALAKATLVQAIRRVIEARKLTPAKAAALLGIDQPKVSALVRGRVANFTLDRLMRLAGRLGQHVEIVVAEVPPAAGVRARRTAISS